jgi:hypothetical protein
VFVYFHITIGSIFIDEMEELANFFLIEKKKSFTSHLGKIDG